MPSDSAVTRYLAEFLRRPATRRRHPVQWWFTLSRERCVSVCRNRSLDGNTALNRESSRIPSRVSRLHEERLISAASCIAARNGSRPGAARQFIWRSTKETADDRTVRALALICILPSGAPSEEKFRVSQMGSNSASIVRSGSSHITRLGAQRTKPAPWCPGTTAISTRSLHSKRPPGLTGLRPEGDKLPGHSYRPYKRTRFAPRCLRQLQIRTCAGLGRSSSIFVRTNRATKGKAIRMMTRLPGALPKSTQKGWTPREPASQHSFPDLLTGATSSRLPTFLKASSKSSANRKPIGTICSFARSGRRSTRSYRAAESQSNTRKPG